MGNALNTFDFNSNTIRTVEINGDLWFMANDVCSTLGLGMAAGSSPHLRHLASDQVLHVSKSTLTSAQVSFPNRGANFISESGLYKLAMRSDMASAVPFQDWVTRVVLPAIRKNGGYIAGEEKVATGEMAEDELFAAGHLELIGPPQTMARMPTLRKSGHRTCRVTTDVVGRDTLPHWGEKSRQIHMACG